MPKDKKNHPDAAVLSIPGWPQTDQPMRIAIMGWAHLSAQGREGSGYNLVASELATGLAAAGHQVFYLRSGMHYSFGPGIRLKATETWRGIECSELINSPNLCPSAINFKNVHEEMQSSRTSRMILHWLDQINAQVVHIHSIEGYGLDLIKAIEDSGRPVVATLHNYHFVCPQVDLLHKEKSLCFDYEGGKRCVDCLPAESATKARFRRALGQAMARYLGHHLSELAWKGLFGVRDAAKKIKGKQSEANDLESGVRTDREAALGFEIHRDGVSDPRAEAEGMVDYGLVLTKRDEPADLGKCPLDQNELFLKADHHLTVLNEYGKRRAAGVDALNHASMVTPPSEFLRKVHVAMGVESMRTRAVMLGQPHFDQINRRVRRSDLYDVSPWDSKSNKLPLRFAFFGTTRPNKGLEILVQAIELLDADVRKRCHFLIHAGGWDWSFRKRMSRYSQVSFKGGYDLMQLISSWNEYDVGILTHVWFENSPLVMLEHLHGGKLCISPRLGGPPDWIRPPSNGLLFAAGEPESLAQSITQCVSGEVAIPSPREVHEATPELQSYPGHVAEIEGIYRSVLGIKQGDAQGASDVVCVDAKPAQRLQRTS